jgi:maltose/maltodextrin transport system permease protein
MWLSTILLISIVLLLFLGIWIYLLQKQEAYRFFYPALVLFVLFSLVPISYSIYVSFTNLKTGHLLERKNVVALFLDEKVLDLKSPIKNYKIYKNLNDSHYILKVDNTYALFKEGQKEITLTSSPLSTSEELTSSELVRMVRGQIESNIHLLDQKEVYHFYRTDEIAHTSNRYELLSDERLKDALSGEVLVEDTKNGQFKLNGEDIGPGYYTIVGFKNYRELLLDKDLSFVFFKTFGWTFTWAFMSVGLTFILGAFLAVMLNEFSEKVKFIYRMLFIIPYSIPFFISVLIFKGLLNKDFGEINHLLGYLKISPIPWLEHKMFARVSVLLVNLWLGFPYMLLVITGILQSIPKSIYEASALEGATKFQNFRFLTLPLVLRSMVPLLIGSFAFNLNNFVGIYLLTGGGPVIASANTPLGETDILISYTYRLAFEGSQGQNFATAAAVSMFIFIIVVVITLLNFKVGSLINKKGNE